MVGRTHGIHAEPTTFGAKLALWAMQVRRDRERLLRARATIAVGKLSGAVGTYSNVDPAVEQLRVRAPRAAAGAGHPGAPARPPRRGACTRARRSARASSRSRSRSATCNAPRCARPRRRSARASRRARARCRTSATRSSRSRCAGWRGCCAATCRPRSKTSRCGTSATSRTRRSSGSSFPTRSCSRTTCSCSCTQVVERPARVSRADVAQPRRVVRAGVQPAGAARAGRERAAAATRRTASCSATRCARGRRSGRSASCSSPTPKCRARSTRPASTRASTSSARSRTSTAPSTRSTTWEQHRCRARWLRPPGCRTSIRARSASSTKSAWTRCSMVASDRISVFDVVLPDLDPRQGPRAHRAVELLVRATADIVANHVISCDPTDFPETAGDVGGPGHARARGRGRSGSSASCAATCSARLERVPGAGDRRRLRGSRPGCGRPSSCPQPLFTPTTKAETGPRPAAHRGEAAELVGADVYEQLPRPLARASTSSARHARTRAAA